MLFPDTIYVACRFSLLRCAASLDYAARCRCRHCLMPLRHASYDTPFATSYMLMPMILLRRAPLFFSATEVSLCLRVIDFRCLRLYFTLAAAFMPRHARVAGAAFAPCSPFAAAAAMLMLHAAIRLLDAACLMLRFSIIAQLPCRCRCRRELLLPPAPSLMSHCQFRCRFRAAAAGTLAATFVAAAANMFARLLADYSPLWPR